MKSLFPTEKPEIEIGKVILEVADEMGLFNGIKKAVGKAVKAIKNTVVSIFRSKVKEDTTKALKEARDRAEKAEKALE